MKVCPQSVWSAPTVREVTHYLLNLGDADRGDLLDKIVRFRSSQVVRHVGERVRSQFQAELTEANRVTRLYGWRHSPHFWGRFIKMRDANGVLLRRPNRGTYPGRVPSPRCVIVMDASGRMRF